ncbi:MAG: TetR/AcrR family transcriptional regulator [Bacteroidota bacterium]
MESKQQLFTQVENLFMRYGIKSVTMDDVARSLGISKKTLYQFVENKADLLQKICHQHILEEKKAMDAIMMASKDAVHEILGIARYVTELLRKTSPTMVYDMRKYYRDTWQLMESLHQQHIYQVIKSNLERGISEGYYREGLNADIVAKLYVGKTSLVVDEALFPIREYNMEILFREYIRYHIHGVASKKGMKLLEKYTKNKL